MCGAQLAPLNLRSPTSLFREPTVELRSSTVRTPSEWVFPFPSPMPHPPQEEGWALCDILKYPSPRQLGVLYFKVSGLEQSSFSHALLEGVCKVGDLVNFQLGPAYEYIVTDSVCIPGSVVAQ